ncbi:MAG: hypothetical protein EZS28_016290, partial [Streblomastix strix]
ASFGQGMDIDVDINDMVGMTGPIIGGAHVGSRTFMQSAFKPQQKKK